MQDFIVAKDLYGARALLQLREAMVAVQRRHTRGPRSRGRAQVCSTCDVSADVAAGVFSHKYWAVATIPATVRTHALLQVGNSGTDELAAIWGNVRCQGIPGHLCPPSCACA